MNILKTETENGLTVAVEGRLDTVTAPDLEKALSEVPAGTAVTLDFAKLDYISSAGLRVLLSAQKHLGGADSFKIKNVCELVMEVFDVTGFRDILTIE